MLLSAGACSRLPTQAPPQAQAGTEPGSAAADHSATSAANVVSPESRSDSVSNKTEQPIFEVGSGEFVADAKTVAATPAEPGSVTLNFQDADIREFLNMVIKDVLEENYLVDASVTGRVTIATARPVLKTDLIALVEDILAMNGAAMTKAGGLYRIVPKSQAIRGGLTPALTPRNAQGYAVRIIPLQHIAALEMEKILQPFLAEGSEIRVDKKRNLVIVSGSVQELATVQDTVNVFDVDWLRGMSVAMYPLHYVEPEILKAELSEVLAALEAEEGGELLQGLVRAVAIDRLRSLLLISSTPAALRELETWVRRLDRPGKSDNKQLYVYKVQNADAADLGELLGQIFSNSAQDSTATAGAGQLAPGLRPVEISAEDGATADATTTSTTQAPGGARNADAGIGLPSGDAPEIIVDKVRNALVILATPQDYRKVESALIKLDTVPLQVLIEASILEVTLRDDLNYGVEWFFKNSISRGNVTEGRGTLDLGEAGLSALTPSFSYTIVDNADQVRLALNLLEKESDVNVLSSPSLIVLDSETAYINVGDEIPVPARQSVSNINPDSPTVNEIQFRQTGVTLTVTPRIKISGLVTMDIKQEVSSALGTTTSDIDAPTIQQRQIESAVAINSGETVVLGGLIQDTQTDAESGIPVLHRIPVLGRLFGQTRNEVRRTELLVLITPRVIRSRDDARGITEEFRRKLKGITPPATPAPVPDSRQETTAHR